MTATLAASAPKTGAHSASAGFSLAGVRRAEWVILAFLLYSGTLAVILPVAPAIRNRVWIWNAAVILAGGLLIGLQSEKTARAISIVRDWLILALVLLAYREMGWFAMPHAGTAMESHMVVWDRLVLRGGGKAAIEALGPILPSVLEIAYALVYTLAPFSIAVLYLYGYRRRVDQFLFIFVLGVLLCYGQFPFWPSEPPRAVFAGQDIPAFNTIFRRFNLWMLGNYGIHTSVFPSAHVAGAFAAAFGIRQAMPAHKWVTRFLSVIAILIAIATVYGRYHYMADAAAGLLMAVIALAVQSYAAPRIHLVGKHMDIRLLPTAEQRRARHPRGAEAGMARLSMKRNACGP